MSSFVFAIFFFFFLKVYPNRNLQSNDCVLKSFGLVPLCVVMPPTGYVVKLNWFFALNFSRFFKISFCFITILNIYIVPESKLKARYS